MNLIKLFENKVFIIFCIVLILFSFFSFNRVSANYSYPDFSSITDLPSGYTKTRYIVFSGYNNTYVSFLTSGDLHITYSGDYLNNTTSTFYTYIVKDDSWIVNNTQTNPIQGYSGTFTFIDSTENIYSLDDSVFFQPLVRLVQPLEVQQVPRILDHLLIILVPVGLIIFGALCLVYLLKSKKSLRL